MKHILILILFYYLCSMETIGLIKGLTAIVVRRTNTEVELDTGANTNYIVCSNGDVVSTNYKRTGCKKKLIPSKSKNRYLQLFIYTKTSYKTILVHRLVALCFISNPHNYPEVNHIDENPSNNDISNLEWCEHKYNINHGTRTTRSATSRSKQVKQLTMDGELVKIWISTSEAGRNGFIQTVISKCCNNKQLTHKGFKWEYF